MTVDALAFDGVDVVGDVFAALATLPGASVDEIHSYHFLEHVASFKDIVVEMARVLKPGGLLHAVVPHFSNPYYYSDYTHRTPFGLYSFSYLADDARAPAQGAALPGRYAAWCSRTCASASRPGRPFYVRYALRRALGRRG